MPGKFINQFACENMITCKDLLACVTCRRVNQSGAAPTSPDDDDERRRDQGAAAGGGGPNLAPSWLPLTFNLLYELPLFVRDYLEREER